MRFHQIRLLTLPLLLLALTVGCSQDTRDQIKSEVSARATATGSLVPTSDAPTSDAPTSDAPTSEAPTSEAPTSEAPTSEAPASPTDTGSASPGNDNQQNSASGQAEESSFPWWLLALAAVLIALLVIVMVSRSRRAAAALEARTREALRQIDELTTHLATITPGGLDVVAAQDAAHLATLGGEFEQLLDENKDPDRHAALVSVRDQVSVLHRVVDGVALSPDPTTPTAAGFVQEQATALHTAATRAQAQLFPATVPG